MYHKNQPVDPLLRLPQVLKIIPVSRSTWWAGVKSGRFPKPIKLGPRTTCWRESDIMKLVKEGECHG
jgi:prophage regulatory protein